MRLHSLTSCLVFLLCHSVAIIPLISAQTSQPSDTQTEGTLPTLEELRVTTPPAFTLMGITPDSINQPTSPKGFGLTLLEATSNAENSGLPRNLAVEVAPYWWFSHRKTFQEQFSKNLFDSIARTFSFSLGTTRFDGMVNDQPVEGTRVGAGIRFNLLPGDPPQALEPLVDELLGMLRGSDDDPRAPLPNPEDIETKAKELEEMNKQRVGWLLQFASAATYDVLDDNTSDSEFSRFGAWLTLSFTPDGESSFLNQFTFLAVSRYLYDDTMASSNHMTDVGGRVVWTPSDSKFPLTLSGEFLYRTGEGEDSERYVISAKGVSEFKLFHLENRYLQ